VTLVITLSGQIIKQHAHRHNCIYKAAEPCSIKLFLVWVVDDDDDYDASTAAVIIIIITNIIVNDNSNNIVIICVVDKRDRNNNGMPKGPILFAICYG
jgi:hypothetical protein